MSFFIRVAFSWKLVGQKIPGTDLTIGYVTKLDATITKTLNVKHFEMSCA